MGRIDASLDENVDPATVEGFGDEWTRFDQSQLSDDERRLHFDRYFRIFPWERVGPESRGFDLGCGSGRWAMEVAPRVGHLACVDPSRAALSVAQRNLTVHRNVSFHEASATALPFAPRSQDFGYSLGVLHHVPEPDRALRDCVRTLKPGAPFLLYLYYRFDHRPFWFRALWRVSDVVRRAIARVPEKARQHVTDGIAAAVYLPAARAARFVDKVGLDPSPLPLSYYRNASFYTMRTDARDRFGTRLEHRFTRPEIQAMMNEAGLESVRFSRLEPYWCAVGFRSL
ncbi:MAG: class I SAM-dependent methyltransferase [Myxococcota bacterium]